MRTGWICPLLVLAGLGALLLWCYWPPLEEVKARWDSDPQYAQGYLVPLFALAVLWARRPLRPRPPLRGSWWAVPVAAAGVGLRLAGTYYHFEWVELVSLVPCLAACCLAVGGWALLRWAWPAVLFTAFMLPLPYRVEEALSGPLRRLSTSASVFVLQLLGFPAVAEQNVILVDEITIGVVEACSGLGMLVTLFALTTTVLFFSTRPVWEKAVLLLSALPIGVAANVARITLTGVLYELAGSGAADLFYHDLAGWVMMPLALALLWLEYQVLSRLFVEVETRPRLFFEVPPKTAAAPSLVAAEGMREG